MKLSLSTLLCCVFIAFAFPPQIIAKEVEKKPGKEISMREVIQPRNKGAGWYYKVYAFEDGKAFPSAFLKEEVLEVVKIEGISCYHVRLTNKADPSSDVLIEGGSHDFWDYSTEKGTFVFKLDGKKERPTKLKDFILTYPYPVAAGKKYTIQEFDYEVLDLNRKVKVPAGEFICVVYQRTTEDGGLKWRYRFYFAKGVGNVKYEAEDLKNSKWITSHRGVLTKYDLNLNEEGQKEKAVEKNLK